MFHFKYFEKGRLPNKLKTKFINMWNEHCQHVQCLYTLMEELNYFNSIEI